MRLEGGDGLVAPHCCLVCAGFRLWTLKLSLWNCGPRAGEACPARSLASTAQRVSCSAPGPQEGMARAKVPPVCAPAKPRRGGIRELTPLPVWCPLSPDSATRFSVVPPIPAHQKPWRPFPEGPDPPFLAHKVVGAPSFGPATSSLHHQCRSTASLVFFCSLSHTKCCCEGEH